MKYEEFLRKYFIKASAVLLLVLIIDICILVFGVMKLEKKASDLSRKADTGSQEIAKLERKVTEKEAEVRKMGEGKQVMQTLKHKIFQKRSERFIAFQKEVEKLVRDAGMGIDKFDYKYEVVPKDLEKEGWKNGYVEVSLSLPVQGSYPQIKKLISLLEDSGHFMTIEGIAISQTNQGGVLLDLKIAVTTYFVYDPDEDMGEGDK